MMKEGTKQHYTVVGMTPAGEGSSMRDDSFIEWTESHSPQAAMKNALAQRMDKSHFNEDELIIVAVFKGKHVDCYDDPQQDHVERHRKCEGTAAGLTEPENECNEVAVTSRETTRLGEPGEPVMVRCRAHLCGTCAGIFDEAMREIDAEATAS